MKLTLDFENPRIRAAATTFAQIGADKQKKLISEETKDRKAVNVAVDTFWKKASFDARRAFLKQLEGFATERNVARLQRFGANLTEVESVAAPAVPPAQPTVRKDVGKAE